MGTPASRSTDHGGLQIDRGDCCLPSMNSGVDQGLVRSGFVRLFPYGFTHGKSF